VVRRNKIQHSCGDLALQGKNTFKFIKSEYLEIANQMRAYCRKKKERLQSLKSIPGGYLASVILAECGDLRRFNNEGQFSSTSVSPWNV
jgi:hypothetical protein